MSSKKRCASKTGSGSRWLTGLAVLLSLLILPLPVQGADSLSLSLDGYFGDLPRGQEHMISITPKVLSGTGNYKLVFSVDDSDIQVTPLTSGYFKAGDEQPVNLLIGAGKKAKLGKQDLKVQIMAQGSPHTLVSDKTYSFTVINALDSFSSLGGGAFDVDYSVGEGDSLVAGKVQQVRFHLFNRGNTVVKNARIRLTLPEGLSIASGAATVNAGYLSVGSTYTASYPILVDGDLASRSYPVGITIEGLDASNSQISLEETVYLPLVGSGGSGALDLEIAGVRLPESVSAGNDFTLTFDVHNRAQTDAINVKAQAVLPEGVINKTKNVFLLDRIPAGGKVTCSVNLTASTGGRYAFFELSAGSVDGSQTVSQYAGTMISGGGGSSANPQLMVSAYGYGGRPVSAGGEFVLSLTLHNTSDQTALENIKVTLTSDDGAFLPVGTSNAFHIPSVPASGRVSQAMRLAARRDADQGTSTITVSMSYETPAGGSFTANDIISVPLVQETRLVIDEILDPGWLTADQMGYLNVNYYNMGRTELYNLRIRAQGDFSLDGSGMDYVGNMASGRSDYFSVNFFPNGPGPMAGTVVFTFEDAAGEEHVVEKDFTFNVGEAMDWGEPDMPDMPQPSGGGLWKKVAGALALAGAAFAAYRYRRKQKLIKEEEFNLDE